MNQMSCDEARLLLPLYIDGAFSEEETEELEALLAHLKTCKACREEERFLRGIMEETKGLPELEVSDEFAASLSSALAGAALEAEEFREEKEKSEQSTPLVFSRFRGYRSGLVAAAVVAFLAVSIVFAPKTSHFIFRGNVPYVQQKEEKTTQTPTPTPSVAPEVAPSASPKARQTSSQSGREWSNVSADKAAPTQEANRGPQIRQATGTSGGAAEASEEAKNATIAVQVEPKIQLIARFNFSESGLAAAKQLFAGVPEQDGMYVIEPSALADYRGRLMKMEGYLSYKAEKVDLTEQYVGHLNNGNAKQMAAIDFQAEHCYIQIQ